MSAECTGTPISWLRLEQYASGDLSSSERAAVATHLDACDVCRDCFDSIGARPVSLPTLRPVLVERAPWWRTWAGLGAGAGLAAAAAAAIALLMVQRDAPGPGMPGRTALVKGGDVAIDVVRLRGAAVTHGARTHRDGDRFKVLFTCPASSEMFVDVAVFEDGGVAWPLRASKLACGNRVPLGGAFATTGSRPMHVCVVYDFRAPPQRSQLSAKRPPRDAVCVKLSADATRGSPQP